MVRPEYDVTLICEKTMIYLALTTKPIAGIHRTAVRYLTCFPSELLNRDFLRCLCALNLQADLDRTHLYIKINEFNSIREKNPIGRRTLRSGLDLLRTR